MVHTGNIVIVPVIAAVLVAAATDLHTRRIPNWLVLPFFAVGPVVSTAMSGWAGLQGSVLGVLTATGIMGLFCYLGGMGMGDLKLCAALGAWLWPGQLVVALVTTALAGGLLAVCQAVAGGFLGEAFRGAGDLVAGIGRRGFREHETLTLANPRSRSMPYAPAIAIGTILSFLSK